MEQITIILFTFNNGMKFVRQISKNTMLNRSIHKRRTIKEMSLKYLPPQAAIAGVIPGSHGHYEEYFRGISGPVYQSKVVAVGAIQSCRCSNVPVWLSRPSICLTLFPTEKEVYLNVLKPLTVLMVPMALCV